LRVQDIVIGRRDGFFRRGFRRFILFREAMTVSLFRIKAKASADERG
jgi:hypothetical protein